MLYRLISGVLVAMSMSMAVSWQAQASLAWDFVLEPFPSPGLDLSGTGTIAFTGPDSTAGDQIESFSFEGLIFGVPVKMVASDITVAVWGISPPSEIDWLYLEAAAPEQVDVWEPFHLWMNVGIPNGPPNVAYVSCFGPGCPTEGIAAADIIFSQGREETVPEPPALWIFSLGLVFAFSMARRTRRAAGGGAPLAHGVSVGARPSSSPTAA